MKHRESCCGESSASGSARSKERARIETLSSSGPRPFPAVAPARKSGRGLKHQLRERGHKSLLVAPARKSGRGLKQFANCADRRAPQRSARSKERARIETISTRPSSSTTTGSARSKERARIETARRGPDRPTATRSARSKERARIETGITRLEATRLVVAPARKSGRGLKRRKLQGAGGGIR